MSRKSPYMLVALTDLEIGMIRVCIKHVLGTVPMNEDPKRVLMNILNTFDESEDASNGKD